MHLFCSNSPSGIRSLICDSNGIVIAETVYRCMICAQIFDALEHIQKHYQLEHFEEEIVSPNNQSAFEREEIDFENDHFDAHLNSLYDDINYGNETLNGRASICDNENSEGSDNYISKAIVKGGSVTCEVCGLTKYYSHISRRYGVFSCESCAKFFYRYSQKPVQYNCSGNNKCPLNIDLPGARCKSCLLDACLKKYILDPKKHHKLFTKDLDFQDGVVNSDAAGDKGSANAKTNVLPNEDQPTQMNSLSKPKAYVCQSNPKSQSSPLVNSSSLSPASLSDKSVSPNELIRSSNFNLSTSAKKRKPEENVDGIKIRRVACKQCIGCMAEDCGKCLYCLDKPKFGGNDVKKQKCLRRRCHLVQ